MCVCVYIYIYIYEYNTCCIYQKSNLDISIGLCLLK